MVEVRERSVQIGDTEVEFPVSIGEVVTLEDAVIVQLDIPTETDHLDSELSHRNIRCIEPDGSTRWEIEPAEPSQGDHQPYTGLWREDGAVWAYNWNGIAYELSLEDGSHQDSKLMK